MGLTRIGRILTCALLSLTCLQAHAGQADWAQIKRQANGQTVWFNAWGGDPAINRYLDWVSDEMKRHYAIDLKVVHIADAGDVVTRISSEFRNGQTKGGSVDLLWINGENFRTLKQGNMLLEGWATSLPNYRYVDSRLPVSEDFALATDGAESPWGSAQLMFIARKSVISTPFADPDALLNWAEKNPGKLSYPRPPEFTGSAFLTQLLINLTGRPEALRHAPNPATQAVVMAPLWDYLTKLHPYLWREGRDFPASSGRMDTMLAQGVLAASLTFNPAHAHHLVLDGKLPPDSIAFGFRRGMIGNIHFVAIPRNARSQAAAQVVANFLLSPAAQWRKAQPQIWGDPSVLYPAALPAPWNKRLGDIAATARPLTVISEPNAAWIPLIEHEWQQRYGSH
ncbi:ABC transporter substrate-binding protein [Salmonella enterica subsp. enterica serovar Choleraesuis]|nr:ABC transporter substrate-binding protein [Salmonella enterica subsp. enterica serovar Choleraesuis]